jgi:DNA polymerase V
LPPGCAPQAHAVGAGDRRRGRAAALARLKREVNARVGRFALRSGATLFMNELYRDEASSFDVCDIRGKMCF